MGRRTGFVAVLIALALLATALFSTIAVQSSYDATLQSELSKLSSTAHVAAELIASEMRSVRDVEQLTLERESFAAAIGSDPKGNFDTGQLQPILEQVASLRPDFQFATVVDARGIVRATAPDNKPLVGQDLSFRDWFQGASRTGKPYVSRAYAASAPGTPLVVGVSVPIRGGNPSRLLRGGVDRRSIVGILVIGYKISSIQSFTDGIASLEHVHLHVTDQSGVTVVQQGGINGQLVNESSLREVSAALLGQSTAFIDETEIGTGVPAPHIGWTVNAKVPLLDTAAYAQRQSTRLIGAGLLLVLLLAGAALVVASRRAERADKRHAAGEAQLRTVQETLAESILVCNAAGDVTSINPAAANLFQMDADDLTMGAFGGRWELLNEDGSPMPIDLGPIASVVRTGTAQDRQVMGVRSRVDGTVRWLSMSTVPIRDAHSQVSGYVSCARDITERIETIRELRVLTNASEQLSASLIPAQVLLAISRAASELCSVPGEEPRRAQVFMIDGPVMTLSGEHDELGAITTEGLRLEIAEHPFIERVVTTNRSMVAELDYDDFGPGVAQALRGAKINSCAWVPIADTGKVFAVLTVAGRQHKLITDAQLDRLKTLAALGKLALLNSSAHQQMALQALTDPLTGVANRRGFEERFRQLPRIRYALLALDVDGLKTINDAHGHAAGDLLIAGVANTVAAQLRPSDMLARTGGDEFVVLLVDCDAAGALELTKRVQRAIAGMSFAFGTPSVSIGSAAGEPGADPRSITQQADAALYTAKAESRRRGLALV